MTTDFAMPKPMAVHVASAWGVPVRPVVVAVFGHQRKVVDVLEIPFFTWLRSQR